MSGASGDPNKLAIESFQIRFSDNISPYLCTSKMYRHMICDKSNEPRNNILNSDELVDGLSDLMDQKVYSILPLGGTAKALSAAVAAADFFLDLLTSRYTANAIIIRITIIPITINIHHQEFDDDLQLD